MTPAVPVGTEAVVNAAYLEVLLRASDTAGLAYWKLEIDSGRLSAGTISLTMACAAKDTAGSEGTNAKAWLAKTGKSCTNG